MADHRQNDIIPCCAIFTLYVAVLTTAFLVIGSIVIGLSALSPYLEGLPGRFYVAGVGYGGIAVILLCVTSLIRMTKSHPAYLYGCAALLTPLCAIVGRVTQLATLSTQREALRACIKNATGVNQTVLDPSVVAESCENVLSWNSAFISFTSSTELCVALFSLYVIFNCRWTPNKAARSERDSDSQDHPSEARGQGSTKTILQGQTYSTFSHA